MLIPDVAGLEKAEVPALPNAPKPVAGFKGPEPYTELNAMLLADPVFVDKEGDEEEGANSPSDRTFARTVSSPRDKPPKSASSSSLPLLESSSVSDAITSSDAIGDAKVGDGDRKNDASIATLACSAEIECVLIPLVDEIGIGEEGAGVDSSITND